MRIIFSMALVNDDHISIVYGNLKKKGSSYMNVNAITYEAPDN